MGIFDDIQGYLKQANAVEKIIYINVFFFVLFALFPLGVTTFSLFSDSSILLKKPWTLISYAFVHQRFFHLFSNLLVLYYIGNLFIDFFSEKKFWVYYFFGIIFSGILFVSYYGFSVKPAYFSLIGASGAVTTILVAVAIKVPHYAMRFRFIGNVELWVLATIWVVLSVFTATGVNTGAGLAHLGGGFIGFLLTVYLNEGTPVIALFSSFARKKETPFKGVYKNEIKTKPGYKKTKENQKKVDAILEKISKSGYDALSKEEKEFLFNQKNS